MSEGLTNTARKPWSSASCWSDVPSSVIATKWWPAWCAVQLPEALVEVGVEARRLGGAAGLARDDEERRLEVHGGLHGEHGRRVGRVEHVQVEVALAHAQHLAHDLRREARAAHAEQDRGAVALGTQLVHELGDSLDLLAHALEDAEPAEGVADDLLVRLVLRLPEAGVGLPEALAVAVGVQRLEAPGDGRVEPGRQQPLVHVSSLRPRAACTRFSSTIPTAPSNASTKRSTPSFCSWAPTRSRSMPTWPSSRTSRWASSRCRSTVRATVPCSLNAFQVASGSVVTVCSPMSSSTYSVSG